MQNNTVTIELDKYNKLRDFKKSIESGDVCKINFIKPFTNEQGEWQFFTPYGLDDLFKGIIRPTPIHIHNPDADQKAASFLQKCPCLRLGKDEL